MPHTPAPHAHQVTVREKSTGRVFETWPVDARELLRTGEYEYATKYATNTTDATADSSVLATADTHSHAAATPAPAPAVHPPVAPKVVPSIPEQLAERSYKELQALAKRAGLNANQKHGDLIAALVPHVLARSITLDAVPGLSLPSPQFPNATEA